MLQALTWLLILFALGWVAYPLTARIFQNFDDKGYAFSKTLGLLFVGLIHWYTTAFGLNANSTAGVWVSFAVVIAAAGWSYFTDRSLIDFIKSPSKWLTTELVFLVGFIFMALVRSLNPEISGTEKPMELAFINAIRHSAVFPPADPWMSGNSISYYYFGYLITSILSLLSVVSGSVAFNLMISTVFALAGVSAYAITKKLISGLPLAEWKRGLIALATPLFVLVISNAEGFLEVLHSLGVGWGSGGSFWKWLDIKDLVEQPQQSSGWNPRFWFWWRSSRVITDLDFSGNAIEIIDEFPFFSFLLGDLHPHVLAIPVVLLLIGLSVEFFERIKKAIEEQQTNFLPSQRGFFIVAGLLLGALGFTNTWDLPIYFGLFAILIFFFTYRMAGWNMDELIQAFQAAGLLLLAAVLPYLPFYVTFSSQAGGFLPNILNPTRAVQLWVMFLPLFLPVFGLLGLVTFEKRTPWVKGLIFGLGLIVLLFSFAVGFGWLSNFIGGGSGLNLFGAVDFSSLLTEGLARRGQAVVTLLTLVCLVGLSIGILLGQNHDIDSDHLAAALTLLAGLLLISPEFVYLRDQFGTRMNTIFKFYYQAWILLAVVSAYAVGRLVVARSRVFSGVVLALVTVGMIIGLAYPVLALPQKLDLGRQGKFAEMNLDGASHLDRYAPDVIAAARWLESQPSAVIVEAVGGSYTDYARFSTFSGQSAVLGWPGHESQWRGSYEFIPERENDIRSLYETNDPALAREILDRYHVDYVIVSDLERATYLLAVGKFDDFLPMVWESGSVRIYQAR